MLIAGKTIKQIALELGVSKQAVWQRIKRSDELSALLEEHSSVTNGTVYVDFVAETAIRELYADSLKTDNVDETPVNIDETSGDVDSNIDSNSPSTDALQYMLKALQDQLTAKDEQIKELMSTVERLTTTLQTTQEQQTALVTALTAEQALHAGTIQNALQTPLRSSDDVSEVKADPAPERQGFWGRLFGRRG